MPIIIEFEKAFENSISLVCIYYSQKKESVRMVNAIQRFHNNIHFGQKGKT